jgi:triphosphoribosyl-dephospho-CoA synthase
LRAVRATKRFVRTNTNLGIIIILAPLAKAAGMGGGKGLQARVKQVLKELTIDDARLAYEAIRLANPGGMGQADKGDIKEQEVALTLAQAMSLSRDRDALAREYSTGYAITFDLGLPALETALAKKASLSQAIVQTFLSVLSRVPDTLIARKSGLERAETISSMAGQVLDNGGVFTNKEGIQKFDNYLRDPGHRLNPGTTADLVAGILFAHLIEKNLSLLIKGN